MDPTTDHNYPEYLETVPGDIKREKRSLAR